MGRAVWVPTVSGPLAAAGAGYERWLAARGYSRSSVSHRLAQLDHLSGWLERERLAASGLTLGGLERFTEARRAAGYVTLVSPRSLRVPVQYLREVGVVPAPAAVVAGPVEELLVEYRRYLGSERGLAPGTIRNLERVARIFLTERERSGGLELEGLVAGDVTLFLTRECHGRSVRGSKDLACGLRVLLRFLHVTGRIAMSLSSAVPGVAGRRDRSLPRGLDRASVERLLSSCDSARRAGRRDYAVLLLLARLGLRAGEVAAMRLEDIEWRHGEIVVHGKSGRRERLPVPVDVGDAIVSYLCDRPVSESRAVFLCALAPFGPVSSFVVSALVRAACVRAGLAPVGAHRLRHTAASEMLRAGASLREIAQVLRHGEVKTTAIYAKVDRVALSELALPWPGGLS